MNNRDPKKLFPHDKLFRPILLMIPDTVQPNHITIFRMLMTPVVLGFLFFEQWTVGIVLFLALALSDALDGMLARVKKQITEWGTFYDPVADKILVGSVILLIVIQHVNPWIAGGIIVVEILLILGGWYHRRRKKFRTANIWGKVKMVLEVVGVMSLLVALAGGADLFIDLSQGTLVLAIIFGIVSLLTYSL